MTKKIYLETLKSALGHSIYHYLYNLLSAQIKNVHFTLLTSSHPITAQTKTQKIPLIRLKKSHYHCIGILVNYTWVWSMKTNKFTNENQKRKLKKRYVKILGGNLNMPFVRFYFTNGKLENLTFTDIYYNLTFLSRAFLFYKWQAWKFEVIKLLTDNDQNVIRMNYNSVIAYLEFFKKSYPQLWW